MQSVQTVYIDLLGIWRLGIWFGMSFIVLVFAQLYTGINILKSIREIYKNSPFILWAYVLLSALYQLEFPGIPFLENNTAFSWTAGQTFAEVLLIPIAILLMPESIIKIIWRLLPWFMGLEILLLLWNDEIIWRHPELRNIGFPIINGFMRAPSFDLALLALFLPFAPRYLKLASLIMIATHHSSTSLVIVSAEVLAWSIVNLRLRYVILPILTIAPLAFGLAWYHSNSDYFDGSERLQTWTRHMSFWYESWGFIWLGTGAGSYMFLSMMIDKMNAPIYFFLHNDWLQVLFEYGISGFVLLLSAFVKLTMLARHDIRLLAILFGFGACALTYHPLRFFPTMFLLCLVLRETIKKDPSIFTRIPHLNLD